MITKRKALSLQRRHNLPGEVTGRGTDIEIEVGNEGEADAWRAHVVGLGGYRTGWGGWVLSQGYKCSGDYNDPASAWHR